MEHKRAQIIWSLWHVYTSHLRTKVALKAIPSIFARRCTVLMEQGVGVLPARRAGQTGVDQEYDEFDAFELALGLVLLDCGVPRLEVAQFLITYRDTIRATAQSLSRQRTTSQVFLVIRPRLLSETHRKHDDRVLLQVPFDRPKVIRTHEELSQILMKLDCHDQKRLVIEVQDLFVKIIATLAEAPEVRKRKESNYLPN